MFMVESVKFGYMSKEEVTERVTICPECFEYNENVMKDGKGCLYITGHLGNFEILGRWYTDRGYELFALAREARDRGTTNIMAEIRERMGIKVININQSLRPVLAALRRNACLAIICDQNATDVFVPFFGHRTGTVDGPAKIALRTGAPMLFFMGVRDGGGKYHVECNGYYRAESTGDTQTDIELTMTEVNRNIEEMIRRHPEQWLWFHDRWKSSPGVKEAVPQA
jgi:KDO2-lipid IV(A) lauroyltransferase